MKHASEAQASRRLSPPAGSGHQAALRQAQETTYLGKVDTCTLRHASSWRALAAVTLDYDV